MNRAVCFLLGMILLLCVGCEYEEKRTETGYKGRARLNPWLAAERFCARLGYEVKGLGTWKNPEWEDAVYFMPAELLNNQGFVGRIEEWTRDGGHLVILCEYSQAEWNDWYEFRTLDMRIEKPLEDFLEKVGMKITRKTDGEVTTQKITVDDEVHEVSASSKLGLGDEKNLQVFATEAYGNGKISVVTDARMFRSRNIDLHEHASLLRALVESSPHDGAVVFLRGTGMSLWEMFRRYLWPFLAGLGVMLLFWLWKSMSRFGPMESAAVASPLRGYDHHLEALGDFQWRLDKGTALLAPLRERIIENGQSLAWKAGRRDGDFFGFLAERAELPRERVVRALSEAAPTDAAVLTRTTSDLQALLRATR